MGRIIAPYGVRGWVKVRPQTEQSVGLLTYGAWWLPEEAGWRDYRLMEGRAHGGEELVARLEGIDDREQAAMLRGREIAVPRAQLPHPGEGEYYWADLIGLSVTNRQGDAFGVIAEVFATGANDVLVVRGERERLIPFVEPVIVAVDLAAGQLTVDWGSEY